MDKDILIFKVSRILGEDINRVKWDMSLAQQIEELVKFIELVAEKAEVDLYDC